MKFAVLSDTHYLSEKSMYADPDGTWKLKRQINIDTMHALAERDDIDAVFITGDLTNDGDEQSHYEFAELLQTVKDSGKQVYVLTATHDFHFSRAWATKPGWPVRYKKTPWEKPWCDIENIDYKSLVTDEFKSLSESECVPPVLRVTTPDRLWDIYKDFGREQAMSAFDPGYSYCVKLDEKLWCLMLNNNFRDVDSMGDASATYSPACFRWMREMVDKAKEEGAFIFACTHHPLVPPVPAYKLGGTRRNMRGPYVCHTLADIGISLVFSGHTHFSNIGFGQSDNGNVICNVTTPSICFYPPAYRIAEIDVDSHKLNVQSVEIPNREEYGIKAKTLKQHYLNEFQKDIRNMVVRLPKPISETALKMKVKHLYPLCKSACGLTAGEYASIKEMLMFDIISELVTNMVGGDGRFTPDTPVYKFMMGLSAVADSVIKAQPFLPIEKKLEGYTITEIIEPMLCKQGIPDADAEFVFDRLPEKDNSPAVFTSNFGELLMIALSVFALMLSPVAPIAMAAITPVMTALKKKKLKTKPFKPERY